jgi:putative peptidoglycan lipid II flippase
MARSLSNAQVLRAALVVLVGFLASGVLGLVRLAIVSNQFGTSEALDAFTAAQRIPETIFTLVAGGALGSSFIPVYARVRDEDVAQAWQLASAVITLSALSAGILGLVVFVLADPIASHILLSGRSAETQALTAHLMRLMMITPFIFSISGLLMGILQSHGVFLLPSIAISMNNIGIIIGAVLIAPNLTPSAGVAQVNANNIYGLAYGAVLSAMLHLVVQLPGLWGLRPSLRFLPSWRITGVLDVLWLMIPRSLGLGVVQLNYLVNIALGSRMLEGSLVALNTAFMLMFFALGVIGQSVGSAVFPTLATLYAQNDMEGYKNRLRVALRSVLFLAIPATAVFILLGEPLVSVFERGEWTRTSTQATAWALAFYAVGIVGFALLEVLSRAFYAIADTWTPVIVGIGAMVSNIVLSLLLVQVIGSPTDLARGQFAGLALANALTTNIEALLLWALLRRRLGDMGEREVLAMVWRVVLATVAMSAVLWGLLQALPERDWRVLIMGGVIGGATFFVVCVALNVSEAKVVPLALVRRLRR